MPRTEREIQLKSQTTKRRKHSQHSIRVADEVPPDTYIDPDIIKAYTGKSDGILNSFNKKSTIKDFNRLLRDISLTPLDSSRVNETNAQHSNTSVKRLKRDILKSATIPHNLSAISGVVDDIDNSTPNVHEVVCGTLKGCFPNLQLILDRYGKLNFISGYWFCLGQKETRPSTKNVGDLRELAVNNLRNNTI